MIDIVGSDCPEWTNLGVFLRGSSDFQSNTGSLIDRRTCAAGGNLRIDCGGPSAAGHGRCDVGVYPATGSRGWRPSLGSRSRLFALSIVGPEGR